MTMTDMAQQHHVGGGFAESQYLLPQFFVGSSPHTAAAAQQGTEAAQAQASMASFGQGGETTGPICRRTTQALVMSSQNNYTQDTSALMYAASYLPMGRPGAYPQVIMDTPDYNSLPTEMFSYSGSFRKGHVEGNGWNIGMTSHTNGAFPGSDVDTDPLSASPHSRASDFSEPDLSFSIRKVDVSSQEGAWAGGETASYPLLERSSSFDGSIPFQYETQHVYLEQQARGLGIDMTGLPRANFGSAMQTPYFEQHRPQAFAQMKQSPIGSFPSQHNHWTGTPSQSRVVAHGSLSWAPISHGTYQPARGHNMEAQNNGASRQLEQGPYAYAEAQCSSLSERPVVDAAGARQESVPASAPAPAIAVRKMEDRILLEGKRRGLTYKEIKKKMHTNVAESTLRGRYRSLTKARKDRVRKPIWTDNDIRLLNQIVHSELARFDGGCHRASKDERLSKISWKRVAEYIKDNGGSYHFGNSTCKKKWTELQHGDDSDST